MNEIGLITMKLPVSRVRGQLCVVPSEVEAVVGDVGEVEEEEVLAVRIKTLICLHAVLSFFS